MTPIKVDPRLIRLLRAEVRLSAERQIDRIRHEYVVPVVRGVLSYELRRSIARTQQELDEQTEAFSDIEADVVSRINDKLWQIWENWRAGFWSARTIVDICGYAGSAARKACTDYLRKKYPGRHALDVALRAALQSPQQEREIVPSELMLWQVELRIDLKEWRVGLPAWRDESRIAVTLENNPKLSEQLRTALEGKDLRELLPCLAEIIEEPLQYVELLNFLAVTRDVEAKYRAAVQRRLDLRIAPLHNTSLQPETEATRHGILQELWRAILHLSVTQRIVILLHGDTFEVLLEIVEREIATHRIMAQALELDEVQLIEILAGRPLADDELADRFSLEKDRVRGIRQDARRRLERHLGKKNLWG